MDIIVNILLNLYSFYLINVKHWKGFKKTFEVLRRSHEESMKIATLGTKSLIPRVEDCYGTFKKLVRKSEYFQCWLTRLLSNKETRSARTTKISKL